jgi:hypothetical protein
MHLCRNSFLSCMVPKLCVALQACLGCTRNIEARVQVMLTLCVYVHCQTSLEVPFDTPMSVPIAARRNDTGCTMMCPGVIHGNYIASSESYEQSWSSKGSSTASMLCSKYCTVDYIHSSSSLSPSVYQYFAASSFSTPAAFSFFTIRSSTISTSALNPALLRMASSHSSTLMPSVP